MTIKNSKIITIKKGKIIIKTGNTIKASNIPIDNMIISAINRVEDLLTTILLVKDMIKEVLMIGIRDFQTKDQEILVETTTEEDMEIIKNSITMILETNQYKKISLLLNLFLLSQIQLSKFHSSINLLLSILRIS